MMWVCPACWTFYGGAAVRCAACGADLTAADARPFPDKVARALSHPEPQTVVRAAEILAVRADEDAATRAVSAALRARWNDPYVAAGLVRALARIEHPAARAALIDALGHESVIVRVAAAECLQSPACAGKPGRSG